MTFAEHYNERIVALIDMDCFYVQVEQRLAPEWKGKPCAVVQYNDWKGGGIIAVGYEARARGVTRRDMRGDDALKVCPELKLFRVPEVRGKADLTRYREAGAEVISVLSQFSSCVERASVDEAYIDLTSEVDVALGQSTLAPVTAADLPQSYIVGSESEDREDGVKQWLDGIYGRATDADMEDNHQGRRLAHAAVIVEQMRQAVWQQCGFSCSAGISHNKVLAKLACGLHKPRQQTVLPLEGVANLFTTLPIHKVRHLGGKLGRALTEELDVVNMSDLLPISLQELTQRFGAKTAQFLYELCRGHDPEPVNSRQLPKSIGCSKNFRGKLAIASYQKARYWIKQMSDEVYERLTKDRQQNNRVAQHLTLYVRFSNWHSVTRACGTPRYKSSHIENLAMSALRKLCGGDDAATFDPTIGSLGLSAGKFSDIHGSSLSSFFNASTSKPQSLFSSEAVQNPLAGENSTENIPSSETKKPSTLSAFFSKARLKRTAEGDKEIDDFKSTPSCSQSLNSGARPGTISDYFGGASKTDGFGEQTFQDSPPKSSGTHVNSKRGIEQYLTPCLQPYSSQNPILQRLSQTSPPDKLTLTPAVPVSSQEMISAERVGDAADSSFCLDSHYGDDILDFSSSDEGSPRDDLDTNDLDTSAGSSRLDAALAVWNDPDISETEESSDGLTDVVRRLLESQESPTPASRDRPSPQREDKSSDSDIDVIWESSPTKPTNSINSGTHSQTASAKRTSKQPTRRPLRANHRKATTSTLLDYFNK